LGQIYLRKQKEWDEEKIRLVTKLQDALFVEFLRNLRHKDLANGLPRGFDENKNPLPGEIIFKIKEGEHLTV